MSNQTLILLGATGNLANLKIYPALKYLKEYGYIDSSFKLIGVANEDKTVDTYREYVSHITKGAINEAEYVKTDFENEDFYKLAGYISTDTNVIFFIATSPKYFLPILKNINNCIRIDKKRIKVMLEKPYGLNYENVVEVNKYIESNFSKNQVYRIDHYLVKEGLMKLIKLKNDNRDKWSSKYIESVSFVFIETNGIEERKEFYKETGAIIDFMQNHILQLVLKTIDEPIDVIIDAFKKGNVYFNGRQYMNFERETLIYGRIILNSDRWENLEINLMTGKKMKEKKSQIIVKWKNGEGVDVIDFANEKKMPDYAKLVVNCMQEKSGAFVSRKLSEATWIFGELIRSSWKNSGNIEKYEENMVTAENIEKWINLER